MAYLLLKRLFDIVLASFGLLLFLPVVILAIILICLDDGLPIFFVRKCIGREGRIFNQIKFRSMDKNSTYITKAGSILRKTALDELPQLINIIKGDMSFVGPRPYGVEKYGIPGDTGLKIIKKEILSPELKIFFQRTKITPGLTGTAQAFAPKYAPDDKVLSLDIDYINKRNFILDLYLIFLSIRISYIKKGWESPSKKI